MFENLDKLPQFQVGDLMDKEVEFSEFPEEYIQFVRDLVPNANLLKITKIEASDANQFYNLRYANHFKTSPESNFIAWYKSPFFNPGSFRVGIYGNIEKDLEIYTRTYINDNYYSKCIISSMCQAAETLMLTKIPKENKVLKSLVRDIKKNYHSRKICSVDPKNLILAKVYCVGCRSNIKNHDSMLICAATSTYKFDSWNICKDFKSCEFKSALL